MTCVPDLSQVIDAVYKGERRSHSSLLTARSECIPKGRDPRRTGPGLGMRADLQGRDRAAPPGAGEGGPASHRPPAGVAAGPRTSRPAARHAVAGTRRRELIRRT